MKRRLALILEMKMQQTKSYWQFLAVTGVLSAFLGSACVVTTSTDDDVGASGAAGKANSAGAPSAGSGTAGSHAGAGTAGAGTAGGAPAGGAGPVPFQCDPGQGGSAVGHPNDCSVLDSSDRCEQCVQISCCEEWEACYSTDPGNQCGWGGPAEIDGKPNGGGEALCIQLCIQDGVKLSGTDPDAELVGTCANNCATSTSNGATKNCSSLVGNETNSLVGCQMDHCVKECFTGDP